MLFLETTRTSSTLEILHVATHTTYYYMNIHIHVERPPISMAILPPNLVQRTPLRTIVSVLQREVQITRTYAQKMRQMQGNYFGPKF